MTAGMLDEDEPRSARHPTAQQKPGKRTAGVLDNDECSPLGMGPRYMISVTKNEAKNEAGCYQNCIA